jgi:hypothetical protein
MDMSKAIIQNIPFGTTFVNAPAIANNKYWVIKKFGAVDIDKQGSIYILQHNLSGTWESIRAISLYGNTFELSIDKEYKGNGTGNFRIQMINNIQSQRQFCFWYDIVERVA